jgi:hypothetical protein
MKVKRERAKALQRKRGAIYKIKPFKILRRNITFRKTVFVVYAGNL